MITKLTENVMNTLLKYALKSLSLPLALAVSGCEDYLDREPIGNYSPESFFVNVENLESYTLPYYITCLPSHGGGYGIFGSDSGTDDMAGVTKNSKLCPVTQKVPANGGSYSGFETIYGLNYFISKIMPLANNGTVKGNRSDIDQCVGEIYFFRGMEYFEKLRKIGDCPIIEECLPDDRDLLIERSKRAPRCEVARFILSDFLKASDYLKENAGQNRLNKDCARLMMARVALYEACWLTYFRGTPFVPGNDGWPGKDKAYNSGFSYPDGNSLDDEIRFLLEIAISESGKVADAHQLADNTGSPRLEESDAPNPYYDMFSQPDLSAYSEVLLWRSYAVGLASSSVCEAAASNNAKVGLTKGLLESFVMSNGLPIYDSASGYAGDSDLRRITNGRDGRAALFIKRPGDRNLYGPAPDGSAADEIEPWPVVGLNLAGCYPTGYSMRKGLNHDPQQAASGKCTIGSIIFRSAEAMLIHIEADWMLNHSIGSASDRYWRAIRRRAGVDEDYNLTIAHTDMEIEGRGDWGAWSAGKLIDPTLYNIRRERRCELMGEGLRRYDLYRWRSMDQLIDNPTFVYGINLYENADYAQMSKNLSEGVNVSARSFSKYVCPIHVNPADEAYNGYTWKMALYLDPISVSAMITASKDGSVGGSELYQNPCWSYDAESTPLM